MERLYCPGATGVVGIVVVVGVIRATVVGDGVGAQWGPANPGEQVRVKQRWRLNPFSHMKRNYNRSKIAIRVFNKVSIP